MHDARRTTHDEPRTVPSLIHPNGGCRCEPAVRPDPADSVPRILLARRLALALVALEEAGHEEFLRQGGQLDAAGLAVADDPVRIVEVHHLDGGPGLRRVVGDLVFVVRSA